MAKDLEKEAPGIIPENEYQEDLEKEVEFHYARVQALGIPRVNKKFERLVIPDFKDDKKARIDFELEEVRRCIEGHQNLPGKYYYYLNHCFIKDKVQGKIRPDFRTIDLEWFKFRDRISKEVGKGIVVLKKRQCGMSWKESITALYNCTFNREFQIGMNSKSEADSRNLFLKIKYAHRNVTEFLKPIATKTDRRDAMEFAAVRKDKFGNKILVGTESTIISVAPTPTSHAGNQYTELIMDEAGECFSPDFQVMMHDGSIKEIKDIVVGDLVMGIDSKPKEVVSIGSGEDEMYRVDGRRGVSFTCNSKHKLALFHSHFGYCELTPEQYLSLEPKKQRYYQLKHIGVDYPKQDYFFDPYWMGLWLGDGFRSSTGVVNMDQEVLDYLMIESPKIHGCSSVMYDSTPPNNPNLKVVALNNSPYKYSTIEHDDRVEYFKNIYQLCDYYNINYDVYESFVYNPDKKPRIDAKEHHERLTNYVKEIKEIQTNPLNELKKLNLYKNKHIPNCYKKTCREDRLKLLAGIIDSDGHKNPRKDQYEITLALKVLATDVYELVKSLGFTGTIRERYIHRERKDGTFLNSTHYRISICGNNLNEIPCRLSRKKVLKEAVKSKGRRDATKTGFTITPIGKGNYVGFKLKEDNLFIGADYLIHHNCDELEAIFSNAEDCLIRETQRVGKPVIFGTVGEMTKAGTGLREFWMNSEKYDLEKFAFWGYNAMIMDEFGNDLVKDAIRWIIYTRKKKESGSKIIYNKFIQKYPLHEKDAFLQVGNFGVGDPIKIANREYELEKNPPLCKVGWMRRDGNGSVIFVPDTVNGKITIYEDPDHNRKNGYIATLDPAEDDDVVKKSGNDVSDLATCVGAKAFGLTPPKMVAEYTDRPKKLEEYYSQLSMLLEWYNNTHVHIEMNKGGWRAKDWFQLNFPKLIGLSPAAATSAKGGIEMRVGVKKTAERTQQMMGLIDAYVDNYVDFISSRKLLKQFGVFGALHEDDDLAVAFGWFLVIMQADRTVAKHIDKEMQKLPKVQFKKVNGVIQIVDNNQIISHKPQQRSNSVLFRR